MRALVTRRVGSNDSRVTVSFTMGETWRNEAIGAICWSVWLSRVRLDVAGLGTPVV